MRSLTLSISVAALAVLAFDVPMREAEPPARSRPKLDFVYACIVGIDQANGNVTVRGWKSEAEMRRQIFDQTGGARLFEEDLADADLEPLVKPVPQHPGLIGRKGTEMFRTAHDCAIHIEWKAAAAPGSPPESEWKSKPGEWQDLRRGQVVVFGFEPRQPVGGRGPAVVTAKQVYILMGTVAVHPAQKRPAIVSRPLPRGSGG